MLRFDSSFMTSYHTISNKSHHEPVTKL